MQIQLGCEVIYVVIGVIGLLCLVAMCIEAVVLPCCSLKSALNLLKSTVRYRDASDHQQ
jgi:hypothetical protein